MNHPRLSARLGLVFSAMGLALLTACGGGGGGESAALVPAPAVGAAAPAVSPAPVVQKVCGIDAVATTGDFSFSTPASATMVINDYTAPIALLTSLPGYPFSTGLPTRLSLPMPDLREVAALGYQATTNNAMGVEVSSPFAAGSVACVAGIVRVLPGTDNLGNAVDLVSLSSSSVTNLPAEIQVQSGQPTLKVINGFEYLHNFTGRAATAVFRMDTGALADPSAARICRISSTANPVCNAADSIGADSGQWVLQAAVSESGIYVLVADREVLILN